MKIRSGLTKAIISCLWYSINIYQTLPLSPAEQRRTHCLLQEEAAKLTYHSSFSGIVVLPSHGDNRHYSCWMRKESAGLKPAHKLFFHLPSRHWEVPHFFPREEIGKDHASRNLMIANMNFYVFPSISHFFYFWDSAICSYEKGHN